MAKIGLVVPAAPENLGQQVFDTMKAQGKKGVGQVFVGPERQPTKMPTVQAIPASDQLAASLQNDKYRRGLGAVGGFIAQNVITPLVAPIRAAYRGLETTGLNLRDLGFQALHNGQSESNYYNNLGSQIRDEYQRATSGLSNDLKAGRIDRTEYDARNAELFSQFNSRFEQNKVLYEKAKRLNDRVWNETYDLRTGQYKPASEVDIADVFDYVDALATTALMGKSVTSGGMSRGATMQNLKSGFLKGKGTTLVENLEKIGAKKIATQVGTQLEKPLALKLASNVDNIIAKGIEKIPGFRIYADKQIAKLGGDVTAEKFFRNAAAEMLWHTPLRSQNIQMSREIVDSIVNSEFTKTPEGKTWLSSGVGQSILMASQLLEGGPLYPVLKAIRAGKELRIAMFGDAAVRAFGEIDPAVIAKMSNDEVINYMSQLSKNEKYGTLVDHFMRGISGTDNAMDSYKYLSQNRDFIPLFKAYVASNVNTPERMQAALAGVLRDMTATYTRNGKSWGAKEAFEGMVNYAKASELADTVTQGLIKKGILKEGDRGIVLTFSRADQDRVVKEITKVMQDIAAKAKEAGDVPRSVIIELQKEAAIQYIAKAQKGGEYWAQHDGMMMDLADRIKAAKRAFSGKGGKGESVINAVKNIDTNVAFKNVPKKLANELKKMGYVYSVPSKLENPWFTVAETAGNKIESLVLGDARKNVVQLLGLRKKVEKSVAEELLGADIAAVRGAQPGFARVGNMLRSFGLTPNESGREAYRLINTNAVNQIDDILIDGKKLPMEGTEVMKKLYAYINDPKGTWLQNQITKSLTDMRYMTAGEIAKATGLSGSSAKAVQKALIQAHLDVPIALRGMGDKVLDLAMKNPLQRAYQRVQGVLRYTWNPFFRTQEIAETKLLAAGLSNGTTLFNPIGGDRIRSIISKLEANNILEGGRFGEAASNVAMGRLRTDITRFQKADLARYVDFMASKMTNGDIDALFKYHSADVIDALRPIIQYPTKGFLNSNMARTLNLIMFPTRYNLKVTSLATKVLLQQPPLVQAAVVRGLADFSSWLNTPDGLAWRQDYAKEIALMKWLTPIGSLDWTMKLLTNNFSSWRDVGLIGGLPFGVWTQILTNQGILPEAPPYVSPESGDIYSRRIPESSKGRLAMAIMDMLGSVYTYPGRTLMLPGKGQINREVAYNITGAGREDISSKEYTPSDLSEKSRREQQYWYNRANAPAEKTPTVTEYADLAMKQPTPTRVLSGPVIEKYTRYQIRQAQQAAKKARSGRGGRKQRTPVPFEQIVSGR